MITSDPTQTELGRSALSANIPGTSSMPGTVATLDDETSDVIKHFPLPLLSSGSNAQTKTLTMMLAPTSVASSATLRQMEDQLRAEMDFNKTFLDTSPTFFVAIGKDGKTLMMNDFMRTALGFAWEEVMGQDYLTVCVPPRVFQ